MRKCHYYHAILQKLYTWFGKNQLRLYLNGAKKFSIGGAPPLNTPTGHYEQVRRAKSHTESLSWPKSWGGPIPWWSSTQKLGDLSPSVPVVVAPMPLRVSAFCPLLFVRSWMHPLLGKKFRRFAPDIYPRLPNSLWRHCMYELSRHLSCNKHISEDSCGYAIFFSCFA